MPEAWQHLMHPPLLAAAITIRSNDPRGKYFYGTCRRRRKQFDCTQGTSPL